MRSTLHNPRCEQAQSQRCRCACGGRSHGIAHQSREAGTFADEQAPGVLRPAPLPPYRDAADAAFASQLWEVAR